MLKTWGIDGLVDMIVGTGGAEIYDYTLDLAKAQYPLDGRLIKSIIKHYEDMDCNFAIPEDGIFYSPKDDEYIQDLSKGDRVKVTLRFRGREMAHMASSKHVLDDFAEHLADVAVVEKAPKIEGRSMTMFLSEKR